MIKCGKGHIITLPVVVGSNIRPIVCWACVAGK
jgi:hypothetical protein